MITPAGQILQEILVRCHQQRQQ